MKKKSDLTNGLEQVKMLEHLGLTSHPQIAWRINKGMRSGDFSLLREFLAKHPRLIRQARSELVKSKLEQRANPFYPFPSQEDFSGTIPLGWVNPQNDHFTLRVSDLTEHIFIAGKTGAGKSNFIKILLSGIHQNVESTFWLFDPNREYRNLSTALPNTKIIRVREMWDNPFEPPCPQIAPLEWLEIISQVFEAELGFKLASRSTLWSIGRYIFDKRGILEGGGNWPTCHDFFNVIDSRRRNTKMTFAERDGLKPLYDRMRLLLGINDFFTTRTSIPIDRLLGTNIIFEFDGVTDEVYRLIMGILLTKAFYFRMWNQHLDHKIHVNIVEEGRVPFSSKRSMGWDIKESVLNRLMAQYRKFNGSFVVLTQEPSSVSSTPKANVNTTVALPLREGRQITEIQRTLGLTVDQRDFYSKLKVGTGVVKYDNLPPFLVAFPNFSDFPLSSSNEDIKKEAETFLNEFRTADPYENWRDANYADQQKQQEAKTAGTKAKYPAEVMRVIYTIADNPFVNYSTLVSLCPYGVYKINKIREFLIENNLASIEKIKASKGRTAHFLVLKDETYKIAGAQKPKGKGGFKSKLYAHLIATKLQAEGWKATIEGKTYESPKLIDVLAFKKEEGHVAYEVTNSFGNIEDNIRKDLDESKVRKVVIVVEDKRLGKAEKAIKPLQMEYGTSRIQVVLIDNFFGGGK